VETDTTTIKNSQNYNWEMQQDIKELLQLIGCYSAIALLPGTDAIEKLNPARLKPQKA
jgi:hypothetical protein